ncbi:hypothetical protein M9Y10_042175 [Tritrichomonas musculus]|uniref:Uncharacterized protein n=1 Tax=Tritrichomonas musculus TaxID=1915356 RepID=A0ABR2K762_9EUKA
MQEWRHKRFGLGTPKSFYQNLKRACYITSKNKMNFFILLLAYFVAEAIGNAGLLVFQWTLDKDSPISSYLILVQLTANWPIRIWRSILNTCVLNVVICCMKSRGNELVLSDIMGIRNIMTWRIFLSMFLTDIILASPVAIAQALLSSDLVWAVIYMFFGFFLNWLFGNAQFLLFEDPQLSIGYCFIWSAAASFSPKYFSVILISYLFVFFTSPLIITTPLLIVLQALTFFEVFGYSSPSEVQFSQLI